MNKDKKIKVKLEDVMEAMDFASINTEYYYDTRSEKIRMILWNG